MTIAVEVWDRVIPIVLAVLALAGTVTVALIQRRGQREQERIKAASETEQLATRQVGELLAGWGNLAASLNTEVSALRTEIGRCESARREQEAAYESSRRKMRDEIEVLTTEVSHLRVKVEALTGNVA